MRLKIGLLLILLCVSNLLARHGYSQVARISIEATGEPLESVIDQIEKSSEFYFLFNQKKIDVDRLVSIKAENVPIDTILQSIFQGTDVDYLVIDNQILLTTEPLGPGVLTDTETKDFQKTVTGQVTGSDNKPMQGVSVVVKGTTIGAVTDANGRFSLLVPAEGQYLVFSFIGMKLVEVPLGTGTEYNVTMVEELTQMSEVIVTGYGTVRKSDLTGSVARVEADALKLQAKTQLTDMISGTVAGFYIKQGTSASGGASTLEIRGQTSLLANSNPLIVLDGVIYNGSILDINPNDIKTIDVLKDASSSAVFGARAAAGVVIITTTKGEAGKPRINITSTIGLTEAARDVKPFDENEFLDFRRDYLESVNPKQEYYYYNPEELPEGLTVEQWRAYSANPNPDNTLEWLSRLLLSNTETQNYVAGNHVDWYDEVMQTGLRQNYDASISGGTKDISYYYSLGYTDNEGIIVGDKFSTVRARINLDMKVADFLNIGINSQFSNRDQSQVTANLGNMFICPPWGSKYKEDGSLNWYPSEQAIAPNPFMAYTYQDKYTKTSTLFSSLYAQLNLPYGFSFRISYQPRFSFGQNYLFNPTTTSAANGSRSETKTYEWIVDNLLKWNRQYGVHSFDFTFLYSAEKNQYWDSYLENNTFYPNENLSYHGLQYGIYPSMNVNDTYATGDAMMARLNYSLKGKYLLTGSVRRDGYSAFGQKNPRAVFPAVAFAWQLGKEEFFRIPWINQAKLRFSWGVNGNRDIGIYSALSTLSSVFYYTGSAVAVGLTANSLSNPNLAWERTSATNFGLDLGFLKDRIVLSADYYMSTTNDLLMRRRLPVMTGFSDMTVNLGELANKGLEVTVNTNNVTSTGFSWKSNLVFSLNRNEIVTLYGDKGTYVLQGDTVSGELPDYINKWFPGHAIDAVWNYDVVGVWQTEESAEALAVKLKPGDYKAIDVNGDGLYTEVIDKKFLGYTTPRYNIGLRNDFTFLKYFTASLFIRADLGHISPLDMALHGNNNMYDRLNDKKTPYWTQYNPETKWGRLNPYGGVYAGGYSVYFPRSFVRIQDLSLSYAVPASAIARLKLNSARIFASVRNLYSFDKWADFDPESGSTPMPRTYTFGLSFEL